jgi:hypothetical protein
LQESNLDFKRFQQEGLLRQFELYLQQREQDRQLQQGAIDRYYSSRNTGQTGQIIGSVAQALGNIFGGSGRGIFDVGSNDPFRTPSTFPRQYSSGYQSNAPFGIDFPGGLGGLF